jgi:cytochrome c biogenesis protein CcdA
LQAQVALVAGPIGSWTDQRFGGFSTGGLGGQFAVGLLLGAVWSPCVGPTLGAASVLASQRSDLGAVAVTMLAFGLGAALPLVLLGFVSREAMARWRGRLLAAGQHGKHAMGVVLIATGLLIVSNFDKAIETFLVDASPAWLTELTTRF